MMSRQHLFIGEDNAEKLKKKKALIIGCGSLGSKSGLNLARWGIGKLTLVDFDLVREENISTQEYLLEQLGESKVKALKELIARINAKVKVKVIEVDFNPRNAEKLVKGQDVVIDGTDNLFTRFVINDACVKNKTPWVYGSAFKTQGRVAVFNQEHCFNCFMKGKQSSATCSQAGLVNETASIVASLQSVLAVKLLLGEKPPAEMILMDLWKQEFEKIRLKKNKECETCSKHAYPYLS